MVAVTLNTAVRRFPFAAVFPIAAAAIAAAVVLLKNDLFHDPDTYWHIAAGDWMLRHLQVLRHDVFSYTYAGRPWVAQEWLSEVLMSLAYSMGGWAGVLGLFGVAVAVLAWSMAWQLSRSLSGVSLAFTLTMALLSTSSSLLARPHLLALPLLALWTSVLINARAAGRAPPWHAAGLMVLWANLHGSFLFGFILLAGFALEALLETWRTPRRVVLSWGAFGLLTLAAALATPLGVDTVLHPLKTMSLGGLRAIGEWQSPDFSVTRTFELSLLTMVFVCLSRGVVVPPVRLGLVLLMLHMALLHQRHIMILVIAAPLILAGPLARALGQAAPTPRDGWRPAAIAALLVLSLVGLRLSVPLNRAQDEFTPQAALDHVPAALTARPVFNHYNFGGYLIFRGVRPYIDGRADLYGGDYLRRYLRAAGGDPAALDAILRERRIDWTITRPGDPIAPLMDHRPGWKRIYGDRQAVIHARLGAPGVD